MMNGDDFVRSNEMIWSEQGDKSDWFFRMVEHKSVMFKVKSACEYMIFIQMTKVSYEVWMW